jgi:hypothetical protein
MAVESKHPGRRYGRGRLLVSPILRGFPILRSGYFHDESTNTDDYQLDLRFSSLHSTFADKWPKLSKPTASPRFLKLGFIDYTIVNAPRPDYSSAWEDVFKSVLDELGLQQFESLLPIYDHPDWDEFFAAHQSPLSHTIDYDWSAFVLSAFTQDFDRRITDEEKKQHWFFGADTLGILVQRYFGDIGGHYIDGSFNGGRLEPDGVALNIEEFDTKLFNNHYLYQRNRTLLYTDSDPQGDPTDDYQDGVSSLSGLADQFQDYDFSYKGEITAGDASAALVAAVRDHWDLP